MKRIISVFLFLVLLGFNCLANEEKNEYVKASVSEGDIHLTALFDNSKNVFLTLEDERSRVVFVDALFEGRKQGEKTISIDGRSLEEGRYTFYAYCDGAVYSTWFEFKKLRLDKEENGFEDAVITQDGQLVSEGRVFVKAKADKNNTLYVSESLVTKDCFVKLDEAADELKRVFEIDGYAFNGKLKKELILKTDFLSNKTAKVVFEPTLTDILCDGYVLTVEAGDFSISFKTEDLKKELQDGKEGESLAVCAEDYSVNQNKGKSFFFGKKKLVTEMRARFDVSPVSQTACLINHASNEKTVYKYNNTQGFVEVVLDKEACLAFEKAAVPFADTASLEGHEKTAIERLYALGVLGDTKSTAFYPDSPLTRAKLCEYVSRLLCLKEEGKGFSDTASKSYEAYAKHLQQAGLMLGFDDGLFRGDENVTAQQLAAVFARVLRLYAGCYSRNDQETDGKITEKADRFADWAKEDAALCIREGIFSGAEAITESPDKEVNRKSAAVVIMNLFDRL